MTETGLIEAGPSFPGSGIFREKWKIISESNIFQQWDMGCKNFLWENIPIKNRKINKSDHAEFLTNIDFEIPTWMLHNVLSAIQNILDNFIKIWIQA